jgi:hypothetical protein
MALNIKRADTERNVRLLAQRTGVSLTEAVHRAVEDGLRLAPDVEPVGEDRLAAFRRARAAYGPPADDSWNWKAEMYDGNGLPRW